ncbi:unnamed protein product, partial [Pelobates cultripes]
MSRPLLGLILLNEKYFSDLRSSIVVSSQPPLKSVYALRIRIESIEKESFCIQTRSERLCMDCTERVKQVLLRGRFVINIFLFTEGKKQTFALKEGET